MSEFLGVGRAQSIQSLCYGLETSD